MSMNTRDHTSIPPELFGALHGTGRDTQLASEIALLRAEIAALRQEFAPMPSLIVTGKAALDAFKQIQGTP